MSNTNLARRTEISIKISGVDVSADINKYLLSMTYTDHEEDKADDLQIELDDRDGTWLDWLGSPAKNAETGEELNIGGIVYFKGGDHYVTSVAVTPNNPKSGAPTAGLAKITNIAKGALHPYHLIGGFYGGADGDSTVYGWVDADLISEGGGQAASGGAKSIKGAKISAVIVQKNLKSDGKDNTLDCGTFEIDSVNASGPPAKVSIKATSLPYSSTLRTQKKTKAWENIWYEQSKCVQLD